MKHLHLTVVTLCIAAGRLPYDYVILRRPKREGGFENPEAAQVCLGMRCA